MKRVPRKLGQQVLLPNREALAKLTKGSLARQDVGNYAKLTPSGRNALSTPDIIELGRKGTKV
jgi:hypothetical protein